MEASPSAKLMQSAGGLQGGVKEEGTGRPQLFQ